MERGFINWRVSARTASSAETGGDFILPNDLPDVKRIVHVMTELRKTGSYIEDQTLSAEGVASFTITYSGDDGALHSASYTSELTSRTRLRDGEKADICEIVFGRSETSVRLANPRKFSVRCRIPVDYTSYIGEEIAPYITGVQDQGLQYDEVSAVAYTAGEARETDIPYAEDLHIPESLPEPDRMISYYVVAGIPSVTPSDGSAEISFRADVLVVYLTEDGVPSSFRSGVDIVHVTQDDAFFADSLCRASVTLTDCRCSLTTDKSGDLRTVEVDITYTADYFIDTPQNVKYIRDMYSTEKESSAVYSDVMLRHVSLPYTSHFTVSHEEASDPLSRAVAATAEVEKVTVTHGNGQSICEGIINMYIIEEKNGEYESGTVQTEFRSVIPYDTQGKENRICVAAGIPSVRTEGGRMYSDCEVYVGVYGETETPVQTVKIFDISETPLKKRNASLLICRPDGESVWDTAKRYGVPVSSLEAANRDHGKSVRIIP